jgi:hypothetical protein
MNNAFAMDQAEKVGLGAALGGHALLLALLVFGLFQAARPSGSDGGGSAGDGIAVSIVSEAGTEAPAPSPVETVPEIIEQAEVLPDAMVEPLPKQVQKSVAKPTPVSKTQRRIPVKTTRGGSSDFNRQMEQRLRDLGGGGTGKDPKPGDGEGAGEGPNTQTPGQIRTLASAAIASEVRPLIPGCAPSTSDNSSLRVFVQLNIGKSANLISATVYDVQGITPANQAQVGQMKQCVLDSLRAASPYKLDPTGFDTWRNHKVQLKVNFK